MQNFLSQIKYYFYLFGSWISYNFNDKSLLMLFNIGVLLLLIGIFMPRKIVLYKIDLKRVLNRKLTDVPMSGFVRYLHSLTRRGIFRFFVLDDESDKYKSIDSLIIKAGGLQGCTPDIIQFFKILLPTIIFSILTALYLITLKINGAAAHSTVLIGQKIQNAASGIMVQETSSYQIDFSVIFGILIISIVVYFLPDLVLKLLIKSRRQKLKDELPTIEMFMSIYFDAHYTVYDILIALQDVVVYSKKYITECCNEFYINPEKALQNMADKIAVPEYQLVCDILKQAVNNSKQYASSFIKQHLEQLNRLKDLTYQAKAKRKPLIYVFVLIIPMCNILLIWFYPWVDKVIKMVNFTSLQ